MKHEVTFDVPRRDLGKTDVHFFVKSNGEPLGKLEVSKGALVWYPKWTKIGHKITWNQFAQVMLNYPQLERRKKP
jgi:hypothetical protein